MKLTYHNSASVVIQENDTKVLIDPWFLNGEYFGAWGIYPPYDFKPEEFDDVDYIYISHIHPDHCSPITLSKLNKKIPILIHDFPEKFLKNNIQQLGFKVIELESNKRVNLSDELFVNIVACDNCNPEICGKILGCAYLESEYGSTQIDTMAVFDNSKQVIVNTNDCPFEISENTAKEVVDQYKNIDLLLVGYAGASSYPQCFNFTERISILEAEKKKLLRLGNAINYVDIFNPRYFMPFAGRYTLAGKNYILNKDRGEPDLDYAIEYLSKNMDQTKNKCIALNSKQSFDLVTGKTSQPYEKTDLIEKEKYVDHILSKIRYDFENESEPEINSLEELISESYLRFDKVRKRIGYTTTTKIILKLTDERFAVISCNGEGYELTSSKELKKIREFISIDTDSRLLYWLLQGPRKAHWNNAELGSHIQFRRVPNIYERGLWYCFNFFYSGKYT